MFTIAEIEAARARSEAELAAKVAEMDARDEARARAFDAKLHQPARAYRVRTRRQRGEWSAWAESRGRFESEAIRAHLAEVYGAWVHGAQCREQGSDFLAYVSGDNATATMRIECELAE